jgi:hypothetical protein
MSVDTMLKTLVRRIEAETAAMRFMRAARALDRRYRPDQPRVPAGNPDGGEWTPIGSRDSTPVGTANIATLIDQRVGVGEKGMIRSCTYIDADGKMYTRMIDAIDLCPPILRVSR